MREFDRKAPVAVWAGIEATINRVGDVYHDQLESSGHYSRGTSDLRAIAELGISALRYPVLWERHQPGKDTIIDWSFAREGLDQLREDGVEPIVGLVHHGSGPAWVSFSDGSFETGLQDYARQVAQQFPWVEAYTPVNEPLTTARFCGLYGHWYPHGQSTDAFLRVLVSECRATILAMQAIREVNPAARLVLTEDLGNTYSTPLLRYQADMENRQRWLSIDLIGGRVNREHPLWRYMTDAGIGEDELQFFLDHGAFPDVIGLNYYITSERYLDEATEHYPPHTHGGNGIHQYADVEAVRTPVAEPTGMAHLLRKAWERYYHPIAITEVHLGSTREQQACWLYECWTMANDLRGEGVDIQALTVWGAFGLFGWNDLCRQPGGLYEPGLFDVRGGAFRPTALARLTQKLTAGVACDHPLIQDCPGWWRQDARLHYRRPETIMNQETSPGNSGSRPLLLLGKTGTLGAAFARICQERGIPYKAWGREDLDLTQPGDLAKKLSALAPWGVVNATGYVRVNDAEAEPVLCHNVNCAGAVTLAETCAQLDLPLLSFSSDLVFDGRKSTPYVESDLPSPLNAYGESKAAAESGILDIHPKALVVRTSAFFGPWDNYNFAHDVIQKLSTGRRFTAADDITISPTYVPDLVNECLDLLLDEASGIWHVTNGEALSWAAFAIKIARQAGLDASMIDALPHAAFGWPAAYPSSSAMQSERGAVLPPLESALDRFLNVTWPAEKRHLQAAALSAR